MTVNLAEKYSAKVDERFAFSSITNALVNNDYDWTGVKTIHVYSIPTVATGAYTRSGDNRYGTPAELQDTVADYTITQDRAFTFTVDKGNDLQQMGVKNAGRALAREIDEVIVPEIDKYRLGKIIAGAGNVDASVKITKNNAYEQVLAGMEKLGEDKVPVAGRIIVAPYSFFTNIRQDAAFLSANETAQGMKLNGQVGTIEGMPLILAPSDYFTEGTNFLIVHPIATVAPMQLSEYRTHIDPPGISGALVEGRFIHDAFVLENKANAIYLSKSVA